MWVQVGPLVGPKVLSVFGHVWSCGSMWVLILSYLVFFPYLISASDLISVLCNLILSDLWLEFLHWGLFVQFA